VGGLVNVAVVFTDLVGSTALASRVGPEAAEWLRVEHFSLLCGVVGRHEGREIKNLGDGLMVVFARPSAAAAASVEMHQLLERRNRNDAGESLVIRTAGDRAGKTAVSTVEYRAVYIGSELLPPLKPAPDVTRSTAGRTIPLKWNLSSVGGPVDDPTSFVGVTTSQVPCDQPVSGEATWEDSTAHGGLQYQGDGDWQYNLVISSAWAGQCRVVNVELNDRTSLLATISFR